MPLSDKWNTTDNAYVQSRMNSNVLLPYNNGVMCLFENKIITNNNQNEKNKLPIPSR